MSQIRVSIEIKTYSGVMLDVTEEEQLAVFQGEKKDAILAKADELFVSGMDKIAEMMGVDSSVIDPRRRGVWLHQTTRKKSKKKKKPEEDLISVCADCGRACCWQGYFMCSKAKSSDYIKKSKETLRAEGLEDEGWWITDEEIAAGKSIGKTQSAEKEE